MNKNSKIIMLCLLMLPTLTLPYKAIFFDVETLFETDNMKASNYVGKVDSLRYWKKTGHMPSQQDLFNAIKNMKSDSTLQTYNNDLKMPLVLSEWLLNTKSSSKLLSNILSYLNSTSLSDIEKTVLGNVINMMLDPLKLASTQKTISDTNKIIQQLKNKGFKIYLVGNWANIMAVKTDHPESFININGTFVSGTIKQLKPYEEFYTYILQELNMLPCDAIWIEKEKTFINAAKSYGYKVAIFNEKNPKSLYQELNHFGIHLK